MRENVHVTIPKGNNRDMNNALFPDTVAVKPTFVKTKLYAGLALRQRADLL